MENILFFETQEETLAALTQQMCSLMQQKKAPFFLALSGGETARKLFRFWQEKCKETVDWKRIRFFWVDERCVPPNHEESNFKYARELLFDPLRVPTSHIYRIRGELGDSLEVLRYGKEVRDVLPHADGLPRFDAMILGIGEDGHTASVFPGQDALLISPDTCALSVHPLTRQRRITLTGPIILNEVPLLIPILGKRKQPLIDRLKISGMMDNTPAGYILRHATTATIFTDCD